MESIKNILVIIASIAIIFYVGDSLTTKYDASESTVTCVSPEVESVLLDVLTEDLNNDLKKDGYTIRTNVIRENTSTEERIPTIGEKSKYKCNTSIDITLEALPNDKKALEYIASLNDKQKHFTLDRDYTVTPNDLGTQFWVRALEIYESDITSNIKENN